MAYTKNTWADGDVVTSEKLNHMEDGIANVVMVINTDANGTLDKTWQEIYDAMAQGKLCVVKTDAGDLEGGISANTVNDIYVDGGTYTIYAKWYYNASSASGHPTVQASGDIQQ